MDDWAQAAAREICDNSPSDQPRMQSEFMAQIIRRHGVGRGSVDEGLKQRASEWYCQKLKKLPPTYEPSYWMNVIDLLSEFASIIQAEGRAGNDWHKIANERSAEIIRQTQRAEATERALADSHFSHCNTTNVAVGGPGCSCYHVAGYEHKAQLASSRSQALREVAEIADNQCSCMYEPEYECPRTCSACKIAAAIEQVANEGERKSCDFIYA